MEVGFILISMLFLIFSINNKVGNLFLGISFFLLFILLGFRDVSVGTDTINYLSIFERVLNYDKPAIISSHRVNFIGGIFENNRVENLKLLDDLLYEITEKWPDVEFFTSDELGKIIDKSSTIN